MANEKRKHVTFDQVRPGGVRRDIDQVDYPGGEGSFGLLQLRCDELQDAHFAAVAHFQRKGQPMDGPSLAQFIMEVDRQEVYRMMLEPDVDDPKLRLFPSVDVARKKLGINEVNWVQNRHNIRTGELLRERGLVERLDAEEEGEGDAD